MAGKLNKFETPSSASSDSDTELALDLSEQVFVDDDDYSRAPASPTTVPNVRPFRPPSTGSNILKSPRARRVRTASMSQSNKRTTAESILHADRRTIYTAGRPPWYNCTGGQEVEPFLIGIGGASASGKTTVATKIIESLNIPWVTIVSMDSFYKVLNEKQHHAAMRNEYNFDHPDAFDIELLITVLQRLKEGKKVEVPIYNYVTHSRENRTKTMYGANVIIFEGILAFYNADVLKLLDMKVFVDTDADIRLARRLRRDIVQRGRDLEGVLKQYLTHVKPAYQSYIAPSMAHADIIVPRGGDNNVAIALIVQHVHKQLSLRGFKVREKLAVAHIGQPLPDSLYVLKNTPQVQGLHTFIRNKDTPRDEFIFYSKRLMRLVIEFALSLMPYTDHAVDTPQGFTYTGRKCDVEKICGVSILRAGETMEQAVCDVCKDIRIGKILIQTNQQTDEAELYYLRLPKDIKDYRVVLMDATVATGAAAIMAIRVLLDHDVPERHISLVSLLMAEIGVHSIAYAFPEVKIVTSALDPEINEKFYVLPGIGNFGDRYFGTEPNDEE
ncbi:uridine-cytidine kinase-like 1 [Melitaea cinxia]|uniref:uridine-cytidine kinase-like 1 n=1 Tax=Melitaea cinxia TaxID=113334 RepID=UPI001E2710F1|nr:uridine-cytidine kinase-like 1 [Melitaea cinxia]